MVRGSLLHFTSNRPPSLKYTVHRKQTVCRKLQLNDRPLWPMVHDRSFSSPTDRGPRWGPLSTFDQGSTDRRPLYYWFTEIYLVLVRASLRFFKNFWSGPRLRSRSEFLFFWSWSGPVLVHGSLLLTWLRTSESKGRADLISSQMLLLDFDSNHQTKNKNQIKIKCFQK